MYAAKAILAALIAFVGALVTASMSGPITTHEWLVATLAGLIAGAGVYVAPYAPTPRRRQ